MKRDFCFDIVRAICVIEIVAYWHIVDYIDYARAGLEQKWGNSVTVGCLACFTFMSAHFLKKYKIGSLTDIKNFYLKRLIRFYPLLFVSATLLFGAGLVVGEHFFSIRQYFATLSGLGVFVFPYPPTLWYFSMIVLFYLLTPFVLYPSKTIVRIFIAFLFVGMFYISSFFFGTIDHRVFLYLPIYLIGLLLPDSIVEKAKHSLPGIVSAVLWLIMGLISFKIPIVSPLIRSIFFVVFLIWIGSLVKDTNCSSVLKDISYSSMVVYLFHRHFYLAFVFIVNIGAGESLKNSTIPLSLCYLILPLMFIVSYYIQKYYDSLTSKWNQKIESIK